MTTTQERQQGREERFLGWHKPNRPGISRCGGLVYFDYTPKGQVPVCRRCGAHPPESEIKGIPSTTKEARK